jgi:hypothetical protein
MGISNQVFHPHKVMQSIGFCWLSDRVGLAGNEIATYAIGEVAIGDLSPDRALASGTGAYFLHAVF